MIQFQCPKCQKMLKVAPEHAGKTVACPCGSKLRVPSPKPAQPAPDSFAPPQPAPDPFAMPSAPAAPNANMWDDLPPAQMGAAAPQPAAQPFAGGYQAPAQAFHSPAASAGPAASGTNHHLAAAEAEIRREQSINEGYQKAGGSFFNGAVLGGLGMMIGAAIWFFVGLAGGVIFFYPPVLFVFGLISFAKGCLGFED